jgi:putative ABC transport system permease protein
MEEIVNRQFAPWRFNAQLFGLFSGTALILALTGLFGVLSCTVSERRQEIGIRIALGARTTQILALVLGQGMTMTLAGLGAGLMLALGLNRFLVSFLYGISPTDPKTYLLITVSLAGVALLACLLPARRAAKVDPMVALRHE